MDDSDVMKVVRQRSGVPSDISDRLQLHPARRVHLGGLIGLARERASRDDQLAAVQMKTADEVLHVAKPARRLDDDEATFMIDEVEMQIAVGFGRLVREVADDLDPGANRRELD